jgi:hypothetical protein
VHGRRGVGRGDLGRDYGRLAVPIVSGGGGGGGGSALASGAVISLQGNATVNAAAVIPFNTVEKDTDGFWDATNHRWVIPAGLGGLFVLGANIALQDDVALLNANLGLSLSGAGPNLAFPLTDPSFGTDIWRAGGAAVDYMSAGDTISQNLALEGVASATVLSGGSLSIARIGPLA